MMWALLLLLAAPEVTRAQSHRLILKNGPNPCSGELQVYHNNIWHYVAKEKLSAADQEVACRSSLCGEPVNTTLALLPLNAPLWMKNLECDPSKNTLWDCEFDKGPVQEYRTQTTEILTCSHDLRVSLEFKCGGRVSYSHGNKQQGYICADNFNTNAAKVLCNGLGCKGQKDPEILTWSDPDPMFTSMISTSCSGTEEHLWHCALQKTRRCSRPASVHCSGYRELRLTGNKNNSCSGDVEEKLDGSWKPVKIQNESTISNWCEQMFCGITRNLTFTEDRTTLTCSDSAQVTLSGSCYGTVQVKHNGKTKDVCGTGWTKDNAAVVCRELGCGNAMMSTVKRPSSNSFLDREVTCSENDPSLWHCTFKKSNQQSCRSSAYVICSGSLKVFLVDGPSRCSGRLELEVEGQRVKARQNSLDARALNAVCRHLDCGDQATPSDPPRFRKGQHAFMDKEFKCDSNAKNLSTCTIEEKTSRNEKIVDITCSDHAELFFSEAFCGGEVQVLKSSQLYWLAASNDSWTPDLADAVCNETRCGSAHPGDFGVNSTHSLEPMLTLEKCPSKLPFRCLQEVTEANSSRGVAWVNCTGTKSLNLTSDCWGAVEVCESGECGGVCSEAWSSDSSRDLCSGLKCGNHMDLKLSPRSGLKVSYSSLHLDPKRGLHFANAVRLRPDSKSCSEAAHIVCTGSLTAEFHQNRDYCSGNVKLLPKNGTSDASASVCKETLENMNAANIICKELGCGAFLKVLDHYKQPQKTNPYVLECSENSFHSCSVRSPSPCSPRGLRCSDWRQMVLLGDSACSGVVFVFFKDGGRAAVSAEGWTETETQRLCQDLSCGDSGSHFAIRTEQEMISGAQFWTRTFSCSKEQDHQNIWACETLQEPTEKHQLKVSCSAPPVVKLSAPCGGRVLIDDSEVCETSWTYSYSDLICSERGCKGAVFTKFLGSQSSRSYQHVSCEQHHNHLGQCLRHSAPCSGRLVSVYCTGSVLFRFSETCGGDIEVSVENGAWEKVCPKEELTVDFKKHLCETAGCDEIRPEAERKEMNFSLSCSVGPNGLRFCLSVTKCPGDSGTQHLCPGYLPPPTLPPPPSNAWIPIVLGVVLVLVLILGAALFLRLYLVRRNKTLKQLLPALWRPQKKDVESVDSEDYEPVQSQEQNSHRLQMVVEDVGGAADKDSSPSASYDNVDELKRPLTSEWPSNDLGGAADNDSTPSVNYNNMDGPQWPLKGDSDGGDSYDDIDVTTGGPGGPGGPEKVQITAEVHAPPRFTEEAEEERPLPLDGGGEEGGSVDLVLGEDDYLVPPGGEP